MPPKTKISSSTATYAHLGKIQKDNLALIPKDQIISDDKFQKIDEKKEGATIGKIVEITEGEDKGKTFLVKKSGRRQQFKKGKLEKLNLARDMDLEAGVRESFNEKCGSVLFADIKKKKGYLPRFVLVTSDIKSNKVHNKLRKDAHEKIYIASEIIGDVSKVNDETKLIDNFRLLSVEDSTKTENPTRDDLLENAIIMILLSNYDIKLDNFVQRGTELVPIDFGNARAEESFSPDVISGIDLIRTTEHPNASDIYSSKKMKSGFSRSDGYSRTQNFYNKNLKPEHFLNLIQKIEGDKDLEDKLWKHAYIYTFGSKEEKTQYADIIVARVRNLIKLKPFLQNITGESFSQSNLRDLMIEKEEELLFTLTEESEAKKFFHYISTIFESMIEKENALLSMLEDCKKIENEEKKNQKWQTILAKVSEFNDFLVTNYDLIKENLKRIEKCYHDSDYISGSNKLSSEHESWKTYKDSILGRIEDMFTILNKPLIDLDSNQDESIEEDYLSDFDNTDNPLFQAYSSTSKKSPEISGASEISSNSEEDLKSENDSDGIEFESDNEEDRGLEKCAVTWEIDKIDEYIEKLPEITTYIDTEKKETTKKILPLLTHLSAHDTLTQVQKEHFAQKLLPTIPNSKTKSPSIRPQDMEARTTPQIFQ